MTVKSQIETLKCELSETLDAAKAAARLSDLVAMTEPEIPSALLSARTDGGKQ